MGSGLRFISKRGKPRTTRKGKNRVQSVARKFRNKHVTRKMLDEAISPVVAVFKKDYGVNIVTDDSLCSTTETAAEGNWASFQCLPGRQCYMEFNALPMFSMETTATTPSMVQRPYSFLELLYAAFKRMRTFAEPATKTLYNNYNLIQPTTTVAPLDTYRNFENAFRFGGNGATGNTIQSSGEGNTNATAANLVNGVMDGMLFNFNYAYLGGYQEHTFVNTTTLPVHGEIVEYWPRQVMPWHTINRRQNAGATGSDAQKIPGLYQTLSRDQMRKNRNSTLEATATNQLSNMDIAPYVDEVDDKGFKYDYGCEDTNYLWKIGKKVKFTVYPGQKFVYKMILPPFTGNSLEFINGLKRHFVLGAGTYELQAFQPCLVPGFSKGVQVRFWGSPAYKRPANQVHTPAVNTFASNNMIGMVDGVAATSTAYDMAYMPNPSQPFGTKSVASHGVRMTHVCVEYHRMRCFPAFDKSMLLKIDRTANAAVSTDITLSDNMANIDPLENQEENVAGNHS